MDVVVIDKMIKGPNRDRLFDAMDEVQQGDLEREQRARLIMQGAMDECGLKKGVAINGAEVYGFKAMLADFETMLEDGTDEMSDDLYEFFLRVCGTIAYGGLHGWAAHYPTTEAVRNLLECNEFGLPVRETIVASRPDILKIITAMEALVADAIDTTSYLARMEA